MTQKQPSPESSESHLPQGPARVQVYSLTDFDQASALFSRWQGRLEQLSRGCFAATLQIVGGGLVRVTRVEANQRMLLRGRDQAGLISVYPVSVSNAGGQWQGHRLSPGQVVVLGQEATVDHCSARQPQSTAGSVRQEVLDQAARYLLNSENLVLPRTWGVLTLPPELYAGLNRQLTRLLEVGLTDPTVLGTPEGHQLEQECVRSIVAAFFPDHASYCPLSASARSALLRRAEEFMRSRLGESLGAIDLCRELSVSDRTLRLAFRERYGLGSMAYFKCLRLNAVRSTLKANPLLGIATVARSHGFHHLGNFANDYRRMFGELPSETQRTALNGLIPPTEDDSTS